MDIHKHITSNDAFDYIAKAKELAGSKTLLGVVESMRYEQRKLIETNPQRDDKVLKNDLVFKLGMTHAFNILLDLPGEAQEFIKTLPQGEYER